jgi:hypothetical protein
MTDLQALTELRDKVKAGNIGVISARSFAALNGGYGVYVDHQASDAMHAYNGSLDAAKALHEAVLPGWRWQVFALTDCDYVAVLDGPKFSTPEIEAPYNPARAWLLAILEALIVKETP